MTIDWASVANANAEMHPSEYLRAETAKILGRVEHIGPLGESVREFSRVYEFLRWNPPARVKTIVELVMARTTSHSPQSEIKLNAWGYIVGVLDEWVTQARIFYLVSGILETTLRSRLNAALTDAFGEKWPMNENCVPSGLRELTEREDRERQLAQIREVVRNVEQLAPGTAHDAADLMQKIANILRPQQQLDQPAGDDFLKGVTFGGLKMFFESKKRWGGKVQLSRMFSAGDGTPVQHDRVTAVLRVINEARNDVAHYQPKKYPTFQDPFYAAATLASWFGKDLQHIYGAIDTRESTELSVLLRGTSSYTTWLALATCDVDGCSLNGPFDALLDIAPKGTEDLAHSGVTRACLFHRVQLRVARHRPKSAESASMP